MTTSARLLRRLRDMGLKLPEGATLRRVNASRAGRNNGAWSWYAVGPDGSELHIGSYHSMGTLVRAPALTAHRAYDDQDTTIDVARGLTPRQG